MTLYNHLISLGFTVVSEYLQPTPYELKTALMKRLKDLDENNEWEEACLPPVDTETEEFEQKFTIQISEKRTYEFEVYAKDSSEAEAEAYAIFGGSTDSDLEEYEINRVTL